MSDWREVKLGEVINLKRGYDLPQRDRVEGNVPIVTSSGITGYHNVAKVKAPGVVTGRYGTLGEIFYVKEDYWPHNTALYVQDFKGNDPLFISYFLRTLHFSGQNVAGAVPGVNRNYLHLLPVRIPPLPTQRRIADILSAYDDLIENNTRRIRILEGMAQAIYQEWFGKVDKESLPEGWVKEKLENQISLDKGLSHKGKFMVDDGIPLVNLKSIHMGGGYRVDGIKFYIGEYKERHVVLPGDIVLANTDLTQAGNVIGAPALIPDIERDGDIIFTHHLFAVRFNEKSALSKYFTYHLIQDAPFKAHAKGVASGTTVLGLRKDDALLFEFPLPPNDLIGKFEELAIPIYQNITNLTDKNANLRQTRDLLLPRLVSGEVEI